MSKNNLVPISPSDLPKLRDIYNKNLPEHYLPYHTINNYIRWIKINSNIPDLQIYSLNGDWSDGTYLIIHETEIMINTCSDNYNKIHEILSLIDWNEKEWIAFGIVSWIHDEMVKYFNANNIKIKIYETTLYHLKKENALNFDVKLPEGFILKQLTLDDAKIAHSIWPHRNDNNLEFLQRLVKYNPSLGIFNVTTGELICWVMRSQIGLLAILHVAPEHQRKGFGSLITMAFSKIIAKLGDDISATVIVGNIPSEKMFEKVGFKACYKVYYTEILNNKIPNE